MYHDIMHKCSITGGGCGLIWNFAVDPAEVVQLLSAAVSMESLGSLLKDEYERNATQLETLKAKLDGKSRFEGGGAKLRDMSD